MNNTIEIIPHVFADALSKELTKQSGLLIDWEDDYSGYPPPILDVHELRKAIHLFLMKHD